MKSGLYRAKNSMHDLRMYRGSANDLYMGYGRVASYA
jgi:hypothetical protein